MNRYVNLGKNTLWMFLGNIGSKIINFLMLPLYTRWLSVEEYGTTDIIQVYVNLLFGLATGCIIDAVFLFTKEQHDEKQKEYLISGLCFGSFILLIIFILFKITDVFSEPVQILHTFIDNKWSVYCIIVATFFHGWIHQFIRGINKIKIYCISGIIQAGSSLLFSVLFIPNYGVSGYVVALVLANIVACVYSFFSASVFKFINIKAFKIATCMEMLKFSLPLVPNSIMLWFTSYLSRPILEKTGGLYAVGIFAVANKFNGMITAFFQIFSRSWEISVLEEFKKGNYGYFYNQIFRILVFGVVSLFFIIVLFNQNIIRIFVASEFYEASKYVPLLVLGAIFFNFSVFISANFLPVYKSRYYLYSSIFGMVISLVGNYILIPKYSITGAALSVFLSYFTLLVIRLFYSRKIVRVEHGLFYVITILIIIAAVVIQMSLDINWLRTSILTILFVVFLIMNRSIIRYLPGLHRILLQRYYNKK